MKEPIIERPIFQITTEMFDQLVALEASLQPEPEPDIKPKENLSEDDSSRN